MMDGNQNRSIEEEKAGLMERYSRLHPLLRFFIRRITFIVITFFVFITIIFLLPRSIPGNPITVLLDQLMQQGASNPELISSAYKMFMEEFGIGKPLPEQFVDFLTRTFRGDLGTSITFFPRKVLDLVSVALPYTLGLLLPATLSAWILGKSLGAISGYKRNSIVDKGLLPIFITLAQTPYYWLAMILLFLFAAQFPVFPSGGAYSMGKTPSLTIDFILDFLWHYILPFLSIVIAAMGNQALGARLLLIYEINSDYINFSDTLGLSDRKLLWYAFKNSLLPQITGLALSLGTVLGGSLITEIVFSYPGTGWLIFRAVATIDYPMIQGTFIILISTLLVAHLLVDIIYAYLDPRVRTGYFGE